MPLPGKWDGGLRPTYGFIPAPLEGAVVANHAGERPRCPERAERVAERSFDFSYLHNAEIDPRNGSGALPQRSLPNRIGNVHQEPTYRDLVRPRARSDSYDV